MNDRRTQPVRGLLTTAVWNRSEGRVRAGWRVLVAFVLGLVPVVLVAPQRLPVSGFLSSLALASALRAIAVLGVLAAVAYALDRRRMRAYGFALDASWGRRFLLGAAVPAFVYLGATSTMLALGWATVDGWLVAGAGGLLPAVALVGVYALGLGIWEEALFRGHLVQNAAEGLHGVLSHRAAVLLALVGVATVHALLRLPQLPSARVFPFYVLVSLTFGVAYVLTGDLAASIGMHAATDFVAIAIFGLADDAFPAIVDLTVTGPAPLAGSDGLVMGGWFLVGLVLVVAVGRRRYGRTVAPALGDWQPP